ncbi:MAG: pyridoxamine 5'-phosphate oxidase [Alphaproteobacteria bacterium HGW-Alphaproteobacteria-11]|nr:MAG: pyridoxamine 5'-phosphate oxidase [Alphaproteobacteria bacterium HGW-Alphaproteobacteria-11]
MAKQFPSLTPEHRGFIERQHIFFTASATGDSRINLSPKGLDGFRVTGDNEVCYLDHTGSGNEAAAHLKADGRLTIMFCAFDGPPMILRLYGRGRVARKGTGDYARYLESFFEGREPAGARQIVVMDVELVQTSCGFGVPLYDYKEERPSLVRWAEAKGEEGIAGYWQEKNRVSIDGLPTGVE